MKRIIYIAVLIYFSSAYPSYAGDKISYRSRLEKMSEAGQVLLDAKMYKDALKIFMDTYSKFKPPGLVLPKVIRNIGLCNEGLGKNKIALKYFREYLKYAKKPTDKKAAQAEIIALEKRIKAIADMKKALPEPVKKSKVKAILFWSGLGVMGLGLLAQLWGYEQYRSADMDIMTAPQYYALQHKVKWKYYTAYGLYAAGAVAIITSFFVGHGKHPLGIGLAPAKKGGSVSIYTRW